MKAKIADIPYKLSVYRQSLNDARTDIDGYHNLINEARRDMVFYQREIDRLEAQLQGLAESSLRLQAMGLESCLSPPQPQPKPGTPVPKSKASPKAKPKRAKDLEASTS